MATVITLTVGEFRADFPEFADTVKYTDQSLSGFIDQATCYISTSNIYGPLRDKSRKLGIELMTAHLQTLQDRILSGQSATGQVASTSIDSISVSLVAPPNRTMFQYWLGLTPYGLRYWALLTAQAPAGFYFGGSNQRLLRH